MMSKHIGGRHISSLMVQIMLITAISSQIAPAREKNKEPITLAMASSVKPDNSITSAKTLHPGKGQISPDTLLELAKTDHITLLKLSQEHYKQNITDYTALFYKQERVGGKLKPQEIIDVAFLDKPFSVLMKWRKNAKAIDKLLYVAGQNNDKMVVHPTGFFSWIRSVKRDPHCKEVLKSSRKSCDQFGFGKNLQNILDIYELALKNHDLRTNYLGFTKVYGRRCLVLERLLPQRKIYPCARLLIYFDPEYLLPIRMTSYDWKGRFISRYTYTDLNFNVGLTTKQFSKKANKL